MLKFLNRSAGKPAGSVSWIIAGLGNPGEKYEKTRHNAGFLALDFLSSELGVSVTRLRFKALCGEATVADNKVLLMKPQTFMNNSGEAIREAMSWYKLPPERLIVLYDDINLEPGRIRIRGKGSDGGHNGIKSIISHQNSDVFPRVKIGVGKPSHADYDIIDWVLGTFNPSDGAAVTDAARRGAKAAVHIIEHGEQAAANKYNSTVFNPPESPKAP